MTSARAGSRDVWVARGVFIAASVFLVLAGEWSALAVAALSWWIVLFAARSITDDPFVTRIVRVSYPVHLLLLVGIFTVSVVSGRGGFVTGDDYGYFDIARKIADQFHGGPSFVDWSAERYLIDNVFTQFEIAVFFVFGPHPLVVQVVNSAALHIAALLLSDIGRRLFGIRPARVTLVGVLIFPSISLWSVLNLKEAPTMAFLALLLWSIVRYASDGRTRHLMVAIFALVVIQNMRLYLFLLLALLLPIAILISMRGARDASRRLVHLAATTVICGALMAIAGQGFLGINLIQVDTLARLEEDRAFTAAGARTAIAPAAYGVIVKPGDAFIVVAEFTPAPGASGPSHTTTPSTPAPGETPRTITVEPFTTLVIEGFPTPVPGPGPTPRVVFVRPNDIVIVDGAPPSTAAPKMIVLSNDRRPPQELRTDDSLAPPSVLSRTLAYLPTGIIYSLLAPFPWTVRTAGDIAALGDMLAWYATLSAAVVSMWRARRSPLPFAALALYCLGVLAILSLVEGNVGTLFRHRGMVIPVLIVLASPTLGEWLLLTTRVLRRVTKSVGLFAHS